METFKWTLLFCNTLTLMYALGEKTQCGIPKRPVERSRIIQRVIGGDKGLTENFPWTVVILDAETNKIVCGGIILTENVVLTAAQCFVRRPLFYQTFLYAGKSVLNEYTGWDQTLYPAKIVKHEGFNHITFEHNIALVKLRDKIRFNDEVRPICLPATNSSLPAGTMCILAGFGDSLGTSPPYQLNYIQVPIMDDEVCLQHKWHEYEFYPDYTLCAGYNDGYHYQSVCRGDSGAGLITHLSDGKYYVYGIASFRYECGVVYTDVIKYLDWIQAKLAEM